MPRNNKTIVAAINRTATPNMGSRVPARKMPDDSDDTIGRAGFYRPKIVRDARAVPGAAKSALDVQLARNTPSGSLTGDPTPKPQSGGSIDYDQYKVRKSYSPKEAKNYNSRRKP
jgi:hypothetical protein